MKTFLNRQVTLSDEKVVTRNVQEKNGVVTVQDKGTRKEVTLVQGPATDRNSTWKLK